MDRPSTNFTPSAAPASAAASAMNSGMHAQSQGGFVQGGYSSSQPQAPQGAQAPQAPQGGAPHTPTTASASAGSGTPYATAAPAHPAAPGTPPPAAPNTPPAAPTAPAAAGTPTPQAPQGGPVSSTSTGHAGTNYTGGTPSPTTHTSSSAAPTVASGTVAGTVAAGATAQWLRDAPRAKAHTAITTAAMQNAKDTYLLWDRDSAVATFVKKMGGENKVTQVYASQDMISFLPRGMYVTPDMVLLEDAPGVDPVFVSEWAGKNPQDKLRAYAAEHKDLGEIDDIVLFSAQDPLPRDAVEEILSTQKKTVELVGQSYFAQRSGVDAGDADTRAALVTSEGDELDRNMTAACVMLGSSDVVRDRADYLLRFREYIRAELVVARGEHDVEGVVYLVGQLDKVEDLLRESDVEFGEEFGY